MSSTPIPGVDVIIGNVASSSSLGPGVKPEVPSQPQPQPVNGADGDGFRVPHTTSMRRLHEQMFSPEDPIFKRDWDSEIDKINNYINAEDKVEIEVNHDTGKDKVPLVEKRSKVIKNSSVIKRRKRTLMRTLLHNLAKELVDQYTYRTLISEDPSLPENGDVRTEERLVFPTGGSGSNSVVRCVDALSSFSVRPFSKFLSVHGHTTPLMVS